MQSLGRELGQRFVLTRQSVSAGVSGGRTFAVGGWLVGVCWVAGCRYFRREAALARRLWKCGLLGDCLLCGSVPVTLDVGEARLPTCEQRTAPTPRDSVRHISPRTQRCIVMSMVGVSSRAQEHGIMCVYNCRNISCGRNRPDCWWWNRNTSNARDIEFSQLPSLLHQLRPTSICDHCGNS